VAGVQYAVPLPIQVFSQNQLPNISDELSKELSFLHPPIDTIHKRRNIIFFMILVLALMISQQISHQKLGILWFFKDYGISF
jgi:hypothetical protein